MAADKRSGHRLAWMHLWWGGAMAMALAAPAWAQIPVPDGPPPGGVIDDARLLDEIQKGQVEAEVARLRGEAGIALWVVTVSFVRTGEVEAWMGEKVEEWAGGRPALLLLVDRAQGLAAVKHGERLERELPFERLVLLGRDVAGVEGGAMDGARLVGRVSRLVDELLELKAREETRPGGLAGWFLLIGLVMASAVALCFLLLARWQARQLRLRSEFHYFPPVVVAPRLGAEYGGGCIAVGVARAGQSGQSGQSGREGQERA